MVVLVVLLSVFVVVWGMLAIFHHPHQVRTAGCIAFAALFIFTGISHFALANGMVLMLPAWVPGRYFILYLTGVLEILLGLGMLWRSTRHVAGLLTLLFLVCIFPANIYAALNAVEFGGNVNGPSYLFFRVPLQLFLLWWVWFMVVCHPPLVQEH